jgi:4-hydroxy 2-oxovalerate aldolase
VYRPQIKVLDCTIRDGGLMNDWWFPDEVVRDVWLADCAAGLDYCEMGYRASKRMFSPEQFGPWRFCDEDAVRRITDGVETATKISIMCDVGRVDEDQFVPAAESVISMVRVATYVQDIDKAIALANFCADLGYETTINIMAVSNAMERDVERAVHQVEAETRVKALYVVDSFGALYTEQVHYLVDRYRQILGPDKEVGIHGHNNQQLAFANTIEGIIHNANFADATIYGLGRAAGNCPLELLLAFLRNPKYDVRPILDLCSRYFVKMQMDLEGGYLIPYMITGANNQHPRAAMELLTTDQATDYRSFWDRVAGTEELA